MERKIRCQSCGMPLDGGFFGTELNGVLNEEYCKFCYHEGSFTQPELTLDGMIHDSVEHMKRELRFDHDTAEKLAQSTIPGLKRWARRRV